MSSYYDELIQEIEEMLEDGDAEEALRLLKRELSMPYIPAETEEKLIQLKARAVYLAAEKRTPKQADLETLLKRLKGRAQTQLSAVSQLITYNLRACIPEIREYLSKDPVPEAAALLVDALAEQEIAEEFTWTHDGIEYTFYGDEVIPVVKSAGLRRALQILQNEYSRDPSLFGMARTLLIRKAYMYLPLSYEEEEGEMLAESIRTELEDILEK